MRYTEEQRQHIRKLREGEINRVKTLLAHQVKTPVFEVGDIVASKRADNRLRIVSEAWIQCDLCLFKVEDFSKIFTYRDFRLADLDEVEAGRKLRGESCNA